MLKPFKLTEEQIDYRVKNYIELKELGESNANIAYEWGISTAALRYFVKKYLPSSESEIANSLQWILQYNSYVSQGLNIVQVAQKFNISKSRLTFLRDVNESVSKRSALRFRNEKIKNKGAHIIE